MSIISNIHMYNKVYFYSRVGSLGTNKAVNREEGHQARVGVDVLLRLVNELK